MNKIKNNFTEKLNEIRNEIKQVNQNVEKTNEIFETKCNNLVQSIEGMGCLLYTSRCV